MKTFLTTVAVVVMAAYIPEVVYQTVLMIGCIGMLVGLAIYMWTGD